MVTAATGNERLCEFIDHMGRGGYLNDSAAAQLSQNQLATKALREAGILKPGDVDPVNGVCAHHSGALITRALLQIAMKDIRSDPNIMLSLERFNIGGYDLDCLSHSTAYCGLLNSQGTNRVSQHEKYRDSIISDVQLLYNVIKNTVGSRCFNDARNILSFTLLSNPMTSFFNNLAIVRTHGPSVCFHVDRFDFMTLAVILCYCIYNFQAKPMNDLQDQIKAAHGDSLLQLSQAIEAVFYAHIIGPFISNTTFMPNLSEAPIYFGGFIFLLGQLYSRPMSLFKNVYVNKQLFTKYPEYANLLEKTSLGTYYVFGSHKLFIMSLVLLRVY